MNSECTIEEYNMCSVHNPYKYSNYVKCMPLNYVNFQLEKGSPDNIDCVIEALETFVEYLDELIQPDVIDPMKQWEDLAARNTDYCVFCGAEHSYMSGPCEDCYGNTFEKIDNRIRYNSLEFEDLFVFKNESLTLRNLKIKLNQDSWTYYSTLDAGVYHYPQHNFEVIPVNVELKEKK